MGIVFSPRRLVALATSVLVAGVIASCGDDGESAQVLRVPADHPTIQEAVDEAREGDLVLIDAGTYNESVTIANEGIVVRGVDRNSVVIDGGDQLANGFDVAADGVAIENLTVRSFTQNGIIFNGAEKASVSDDGDASYGTGDDVLDGYRVSYVTAANNGLYGIYAFAARNGTIEHSLASGHPDSGIYIGQCKPCNTLVRNVIAEYNAIGYYGTNASGDVYLVESIYRHNRVGIAPNSQDAERLAPQEESVVAANLVIDNDEPRSPAVPEGYFGVGIAVGGGTRNRVIGNHVVGHDGAGIALIRLGLYEPIGNEVTGNTFDGNAVDLVFDSPSGRAWENCFGEHPKASTAPANLLTLLPCGGPQQTAIPTVAFATPTSPPDVDHRTIPLPSDQPSMPNAADMPARPARGTPAYPELDELVVPAVR
jgi:hypothetical protein